MGTFPFFRHFHSPSVKGRQSLHLLIQLFSDPLSCVSFLQTFRGPRKIGSQQLSSTNFFRPPTVLFPSKSWYQFNRNGFTKAQCRCTVSSSLPGFESSAVDRTLTWLSTPGRRRTHRPVMRRSP